MGIVKEFKEFAVKGNVVDLAVGIIIGAAFGAIVKSLVDDVIMPIVGLLLGGIDFKNRYYVLQDKNQTVGGDVPLEQARAAGDVVIAYGAFINNIIVFIIVAWAVFLLVKAINRLKRQKKAAPADPTERVCTYCFNKIPIQATRCGHCTSELPPLPPKAPPQPMS